MRCGIILLVCFLLGACVREETTQTDSLRVNVQEGYLNRYRIPVKKSNHEPSWVEEASAQLICGIMKQILFGGKFWRDIEEEEERKEEARKARGEFLKSLSLVFVDPNNHWDRVALRFNPGKTNLPNNDHIRSLCKNPSVQLEFLSKEDPILHHSFLWSPPPNLGSIDLHFSQDGFLVVNGERLTPKPSPP